MCAPVDYKNNCGNCDASSCKGGEEPCGECLATEMETKVPYTLWRAKST